MSTLPSVPGSNGAGLPWVDTHCHLDAAEFAADREQVLQVARAQGVERIVIPAVHAAHFAEVVALAHTWPGGHYTLGIHPLYTSAAQESDLELLAGAVVDALSDPAFLGIGEIGLDLFVDTLRQGEMLQRQQYFFAEQLKLAARFSLPVILHVRRAQDEVLKGLRRCPVPSGIAHAFNGSRQQAEQYLKLGIKLGMGGAMTWSRALRIRALASELPDDALVLETDAPDIPPQWLAGQYGNQRSPGRNTPGELPRIGALLAELRGCSVDTIAHFTAGNAQTALPRMKPALI